jgi:hypothetical protein
MQTERRIMSILPNLKSFDDYRNPFIEARIKTRSLPSPAGHRFPIDIYIVKAVGYSVYKIGKSRNAKRRFAALVKKYGDLELVHVIHSTHGSLEKDLHKMFKIRRVRVGKSREWFTLNDDDLNWLKTLKYVGPKKLAQEFDDTTRFLLSREKG